MKCDTKAIKGCNKVARHSNTKAMTMEEIVNLYRSDYHRGAEDEQKWFSKASNLKEAIGKAVLSELNAETTPSKKRMSSHQRRIGRNNLKEVAPYFVKKVEQYRSAKSYDEIMKITGTVAIPKNLRIGELARYDFSDRIAAFRNMEPEHIYLHAGTKVGARNLGYKDKEILSRAKVIKKYPELSEFSERHIENLFCIFKDNLTPPK